MAETIIDTLVTEFVYRTRADQLKGLDKQLGKVQGGLIKAAGLFTTIGTAAVGAFGVAAKAAIDWQSAFTGVRKTVSTSKWWPLSGSSSAYRKTSSTGCAGP